MAHTLRLQERACAVAVAVPGASGSVSPSDVLTRELTIDVAAASATGETCSVWH